MEPKPIVELHTYIFGILLMNSYDKCRYIFLSNHYNLQSVHFELEGEME